MNLQQMPEATRPMPTLVLVRPKITHIKRDPQNLIAPLLLRILKWEQVRQLIILVIALVTTLTCSIYLVLEATVLSASWLGYAVPSVLLAFALWKGTSTAIEALAFRGALMRYREDLKMGLASTPPFLAKHYVSLNKKQVAHNWLTTFIIFYGGIITVLLWFLKDASWWIFDFKSWIGALFNNATMMAWAFTAVLILVFAIHIIFAIQRKKRLYDLETYFGEKVVPATEIDALRREHNKFYRRLFVISILLILVLPLIVRLLYRLIKRK